MAITVMLRGASALRRGSGAAVKAPSSGRAACREPGIDADLFFPVGDSGPAVRQAAAAKAVCARCPVVAQCRDWALASAEPDGIWGGMTAAERRIARRSLLVLSAAGG